MNAAWPTFGLASDVRPLLARAVAAEEPAALVTLFGADGAAPLGVGSQMLFTPTDQCGFLSGGCVEGDVALHAREALDDGLPRRLVYGRGGPPDIRLLCGARIELLVEPVGAEQAKRLLALAHDRRAALWLSDGTAQVVLEEGGPRPSLPPGLAAAEAAAARTTAAAGAAGEAIFRRYDPRARLVIVGGDPVALATAKVATDAELEVVLIRPKGPAEPPPVAGVRYLRDPPEAALQSLGLDPWTAVAALSHDLELDHEALRLALPSTAAYVGVLGSRRRIAERAARLRADRLDAADVRKLRAPIGLEIGARTPYEIAVSIVAEVVAAFRAQDSRRTWPCAEAQAAP
jgi:xanthine dehydrogenase accessory factor